MVVCSFIRRFKAWILSVYMFNAWLCKITGTVYASLSLARHTHTLWRTASCVCVCVSTALPDSVWGSSIPTCPPVHKQRNCNAAAIHSHTIHGTHRITKKFTWKKAVTRESTKAKTNNTNNKSKHKTMNKQSKSKDEARSKLAENMQRKQKTYKHIPQNK